MSWITRNIKNKTFIYYLGSKQVTNKDTLERISKLHIPPKWTSVRVSSSDTDYLQATGEDSKGRVQYIYHPIFVELGKIEKYDRMKLFASKLPVLIKHVSKKLTSRMNLSDREYIIALIFRILTKTHSRIGNDCYSKENHTYGLTTLLKKHLSISGDTITLAFVGKKNVKQQLVFTDKLSAHVLRELRKIPGDRLFKTLDGTPIRSVDMNDYLKSIIGEDFTCKDFRTYASNELFLQKLYTKEIPTSMTQAKKILNTCYDEVAQELGHTRAISRASYVMPCISQSYLEDPAKFIRAKHTLSDILKHI